MPRHAPAQVKEMITDELERRGARSGDGAYVEEPTYIAASGAWVGRARVRRRLLYYTVWDNTGEMSLSRFQGEPSLMWHDILWALVLAGGWILGEASGDWFGGLLIPVWAASACAVLLLFPPVMADVLDMSGNLRTVRVEWKRVIQLGITVAVLGLYWALHRGS